MKKDILCYEFVLECWIESAADEIERLRAEIDRLRGDLDATRH